MNGTLSRRYVVTLAVIAVAILVAGTALRPKKGEPEPMSPSETAFLKARVRREELSETASFFAQRAEAISRNVFYDPEHKAGAVGWQKPGQVLTAVPDRELSSDALVLRKLEGSTPVRTRTAEQEAGRWLLIVGRTAEDKLLWTPAIYGGSRQSTCSGEVTRELVVNARVDPALTGAGVFNLDGDLVAVVARCDEAQRLVDVDSVPMLLSTFGKRQRDTGALYGFRVEPLTPAEIELFSAESGLMVSEITEGFAAQRAGLRAGDLIVQAGSDAISTQAELARALETGDDRRRTLEVRRSGRRISIALPAHDAAEAFRAATDTLGIHALPATRAEMIVAVAAATPAYKAGLRSGDQLLRLGDASPASAIDLSRAISKGNGKPLLVVYRRGQVQRAGLIRP